MLRWIRRGCFKSCFIWAFRLLNVWFNADYDVIFLCLWNKKEAIASLYPPSTRLYLPSFLSLPYAGAPPLCTAISDPRGDCQAPLPHPTLKIMTHTITMYMGLCRNDPSPLRQSVSQIETSSAPVVCMVGRVHWDKCVWASITLVADNNAHLVPIWYLLPLTPVSILS